MTATPPRRPMALPFVLFTVGIGLSGYYGWQWTQLPHYSEQDIEASAELNLRLDQQRNGGGPALSSEQLTQHRETMIREVRADIADERQRTETGLGAGLIALVASLGNFVLMRLLHRAAATRT